MNQANLDFFARYYQTWLSRFKAALAHQVLTSKKLLFGSLNSIKMPIDGIRILDIGFGSGAQLFEFDASCSIAGVEISEEAIKAAGARAHRKRYRSYTFKHSEKDGRVPFKDASFDLVIASHIVEHMEDDVALLREIHRVLDHGGVGAIVIPLESERDDIIAGEEQIKKEWLRGQSYHVRAYNFVTFDQLVRNTDFEVISARRWDRMQDVIKRYRLSSKLIYRLAAFVVRAFSIMFPFRQLDLLDGWLARKEFRARQGIWFVRKPVKMTDEKESSLKFEIPD